MTQELIKDKAIILFDGNCGLCDRSVKFILKKEKAHTLFFCALQSETGKDLLKHFSLEGRNDSMVFIKNDKAYVRSSAALRTSVYLKGLWPTAISLLIVPPFIRNFVYDYIAKHRIQWFGTTDYCEMMTPELRKRFL